MEELIEVLASLENHDERSRFLAAFLSHGEAETLSNRWRVFAALLGGATQRQAQALTLTGIATVSRAARQLRSHDNILELVFSRLESKRVHNQPARDYHER